MTDQKTQNHAFARSRSNAGLCDSKHENLPSALLDQLSDEYKKTVLGMDVVVKKYGIKKGAVQRYCQKCRCTRYVTNGICSQGHNIK
jgi:hypothetical protein